jgi:hypothetical protein
MATCGDMGRPSARLRSSGATSFLAGAAVAASRRTRSSSAPTGAAAAGPRPSTLRAAKNREREKKRGDRETHAAQCLSVRLCAHAAATVPVPRSRRRAREEERRHVHAVNVAAIMEGALRLLTTATRDEERFVALLLLVRLVRPDDAAAVHALHAAMPFDWLHRLLVAGTGAFVYVCVCVCVRKCAHV